MSDNVFYLGEEGKLPILVVFEPSTWNTKGMTANYAILYDAAIGEDEDLSSDSPSRATHTAGE